MQTPAKTDRRNRGPNETYAMVAVLVAATAIGILYLLAQSHEGILYSLSNGLPPVLAFIALITASVGLLKYGVSMKDRISIVWLGFSVGVLLWFLGELSWAVYTLWFWIPIPFPSPADGFWLAGYVPWGCALLIQAWPFREYFFSGRMRATILLVFVLAVLLLWLLMPPTYAFKIEKDLITIVARLAYPIVDAALLVVALPILFFIRKGVFWRPYVCVIVGVILAFAGDILFTWANLSGVYYDGSYLELFYHWSYLALAYGFYLRWKRGTAASMLN